MVKHYFGGDDGSAVGGAVQALMKFDRRFPASSSICARHASAALLARLVALDPLARTRTSMRSKLSSTTSLRPSWRVQTARAPSLRAFVGRSRIGEGPPSAASPGRGALVSSGV